MPRVRELTFDCTKIKISPLSWDETETYIKESQEMLARDATKEEWATRTLETVAKGLNKAGSTNGGKTNWDPKSLMTEYDIFTIQELYEEIMKMSGLRMKVPEAPAEGAKQGEAPATSTLP